jgi:hypothetical protein
MTVITGALIQSEFGTSVAATALEVIIDSAIDSVNSDAGVTIGYMTGVAGAKTITVTGNEAAAIKPMVAMKLASRVTIGASSSSASMGGISMSQSASSGAGDINADQYRRAISILKGDVGIPFTVATDNADLEEDY